MGGSDAGDPLLSRGARIDRYVVEDLLGQGAYAAVYRVRHAELGTRHALKVLTGPSRSLRARFQREGRVQAGLVHPNVVRVTDVVAVDGSAALVMELVEGPSLEQLLSERRPTLEECDALVPPILAGAAAAHAAGLIHRDLKPANILLAPAEHGWIPKVSDFGLVKLLDDGPAPTTRTRSGAFLGTPAYTAPEQMRDASRVDARADVFSLGAVLYEMATGRRAFPQDDFIEVLQAAKAGRFERPRAVRPEIPARMERAILGALAPEREDRIADCELLLAIWRGEAGVATRKPRRRWGIAAAAGALSLALATLPWTAFGPPAASPAPAPRPSPEARSPGEPPTPDPTPGPVVPVETHVPAPIHPRPAPVAAPVVVTVTSQSAAIARASLDGRPGALSGRNGWRFVVPAGRHLVELTATDGRTARASVSASADTSWCWDFDAGAPCP